MSFEINEQAHSQTGEGDSFFNDEQRQQVPTYSNPTGTQPRFNDFKNSDVFDQDLQAGSGSYNDRVQQLQDELQAQEDQQKQQIIHTETIVFIKLETSFHKVNSLFKQRQQIQTNFAFEKISNYKNMSMNDFKKRSKLMLVELSSKLSQMIRTIGKRRKQQKEYVFSRLILIYKLSRIQQKFALEKEKVRRGLMNVINQKDTDLQCLVKKQSELTDNIQNQKAKEQDLLQKIQLVEQSQVQLENEFSMNKRNQFDRKGSTRVIDQRIRGLEQENLEFQEKLMGSEDSISNFIREMTELLDSHEISTNPDSDENASYENPPPQDYSSQRQYASQQLYSRNSNNQKGQTGKPNPKNFYSNQLTRSNRIN